MISITIIVFLLCPGAEAGDGGDDFFNNFFTDLSPLIALFGERVTLQYMSQSINVADSLLLSIAPLGILTIVVAAIRVASPVWIKAIVGRSRENLAAAEMEVMSSTSAEVCELCNGDNMVRTLGAGSIKEFIILKPLSQTTIESEHKANIKAMTWEEVTEAGIIKAVDEGGWFQDLMSVFIGQRHNTGDEHTAPQEHQERPDYWIITRNPRLQDTAPNVTLNYNQVTAARERELWLFALIGFFTQCAILVFAASITYYPFLNSDDRFQKNGHRVPTYGFSLLATGTVLVSFGLFKCAQVVQKSTEEIRYGINKEWGAQMVWIQQKQVVNDQYFPPYLIHGNNIKAEYITSSRRGRPPPKKDDGGENIISNEKRSPAFSYLLEFIQSVQGHLSRYLYQALGVPNQDYLQVETIFGTLVSVVGYAIQFFGLRALHWSVSLFQLCHSLLMTAVRTWVRRGVASPPMRKSLDACAGYELELLTASLAVSPVRFEDMDVKGALSLTWEPLTFLVKKSEEDGTGRFEGLTRADTFDKSSSGKSAMDYHIIDTMLPSGSRYWQQSKIKPADPGHDSERQRSFDSTSSYQPSRYQPSRYQPSRVSENRAEKIFNLRVSLGSLSGWQQPAFEEAIRLSSAIEATLRNIYPDGYRSADESAGFPWNLPVWQGTEHSSKGPAPARTVQIRIKYAKGVWTADVGDIQAVLALRLFSAQQQDRRAKDAGDRTEPSLSQTPQSTEELSQSDFRLHRRDLKTQKYLRFLGPECSGLGRDLDHWIPGSLDSLVKVGVHSSETRAARFLRPEIQESRNKDHLSDTSYLAVETFDTLTDLHTKDTFTSFVAEVAKHMDCIAEDTPSRVEVDRANAEWETKHQTIDLKVENKSLANLVKAVVKTGFGDKMDIYLHFLPALSFANKLPLTAVQGLETRARWHFRHHRLETATSRYDELWKSLQYEDPGSRLWTALVTSQFEFGAACFKVYRSLMDNFSKSEREQCFSQRSHLRRSLQHLHKEPALNWRRLCRSDKGHTMIEVLRETYKADRHYDGLAYVLWIEQNFSFPQTYEKPDRNTARGDSSTVKLFYRDILGQTGLHHYVAGFLDTSISETGDREEMRRRGKKGFRSAGDRERREAFEKGSSEFAEYVNIRDNRGRTALHLAAESDSSAKHTAISSLVHDLGANPRLQDMYGLSPLHVHVCRESPNVNLTRLLINNGADVNAADYWRNTPLHCCIGRNSSGETVKELLEAGAGVNVRNKWSETPLHIASKKKHKFVKMLVQQRHINIEAKNTWGRTALCNAVLYDKWDIMELLLEYKADVQIVDKSCGWSLLHIIAAGGTKKMAENVLRTKAYNTLNKEHRDRSYRTPLHVAAEWGNGKVMEVFLKNGADMTALDAYKSSPMQSAVQKAGESAAITFSQDDLHDVASISDVTAAKLVDDKIAQDSSLVTIAENRLEMIAATRIEMNAASRLEDYITRGLLHGDTEAWRRAIKFLHELPSETPEDHLLKLEDWKDVNDDDT